MKYKITKKLIFYFTTVLLLFSIVIGTFFAFLFRQHTINLHKKTLEEQALNIAEKLSNYLDINRQRFSHRHENVSEIGAYLKFLNDIALTDVWIVDNNGKIITQNCKSACSSYLELPNDAETIVANAFTGKTSFSKSFSELLNTPSITVGTPVIANDQIVTAVILLHAPVKGIDSAVKDGFRILFFSIIIALLLSVIVSIVLSLHFIQPLNKMESTTKKLIEGKYTIKTGVSQKDEIGSLAHNIDILSERLSKASKESTALEKMRQNFISNISHELRTPVTVIRGSLEAICDGIVTEPEQINEYHHQMLSESIYLHRLINDLLELSRLQNTEFHIEMTSVSLCAIAEDVIRSMRHVAEKKKISIILKKEPSQFIVFGDYGRLRQMFMIILDNAIKFSPEEKSVVVTLVSKENCYILSITDFGPGIAPEDLVHIFDRFYKTSSEQNKSGTGLGLSIAKQIAVRHHVDLQIKSKPNQKTIFSFVFPPFKN